MHVGPGMRVSQNVARRLLCHLSSRDASPGGFSRLPRAVVDCRSACRRRAVGASKRPSRPSRGQGALRFRQMLIKTQRGPPEFPRVAAPVGPKRPGCVAKPLKCKENAARPAVEGRDGRASNPRPEPQPTPRSPAHATAATSVNRRQPPGARGSRKARDTRHTTHNTLS
jgi:hypothetical protein